MAEPSGDTGTDQILALGSALLNNFIYERICRHQNSDAEVIRSQLGGDELCDPRHEKIAQCLQQIANKLDGNEKLQEMIEDILKLLLTPSDIPNILTRVAREIFSDGKFNWGRVVALFWFACRLVMKAILDKILEMTETIINWIGSYIKEHLINWIREQGGWEGIRSCFGPPTWQTIGVFLAGVLTTLVVIYKMK